MKARINGVNRHYDRVKNEIWHLCRSSPLVDGMQALHQKKNVGSVIRGFKSAVTSFARKNNIKFEWQPLYWEHLIRSETELTALSSYIRNNPANWGKKMNPLNSEIG